MSNNATAPAAHPRGGQREKVIFQINSPVAITLERDRPSWPVDGNWGPQFMYSLEGDRVAFLEPEVHEQLLAANAQQGDTFTITKTKDGRKNVWVVMRGDVAAQAARAISAPAPAQAQPTPLPMRRAPASTPAINARIEAAEKENAATRAAREASPAPQRISGNVMQAALVCAIEATHAAAAHAESIGASYRPSSEDVRALAITIYIEVTGSGGRKR